MPIQLNPKGPANARQLIKDGKVDRDTPWSWTPDDENGILGDADWQEYGKWFLGVDDQEDPETKAHYRYPIGKDGRVYRSALIGDRQRSGQQHDRDIFEAAGELIELIDGQDDEEDGGKNGGKLGSLSLIHMWHAQTAQHPFAMIPGHVPRRALGFQGDAPIARPAVTRPANASSGAIAVIALSGVIAQHPDWFSDTSVDEFSADLASAINDPGIGAILVSIDSPGGSVYGIQELASMILAARSQKPIVALANSLAASAAYWIGCSASELYVTPSGEVGSIGVWQAHMDVSAALEQAGINTTLISAGKYKTEGNPYQPLDDDAVAFMQSRINDYYNAFVAAVASARGVDPDDVRNGMGQGRVLGAQAAKSANMVDGVATMPQVIQAMQKNMAAAQPHKASRLALARKSLSILG